MKLIPINSSVQTKTFKINHKKIERKQLEKVSNNDPHKIIPSGMYSIIIAHKRMLLQSIIFFSLAFSAILSLLLFFSLILHTGWFAYLLPISLLFMFGYKWIILIMQYSTFNKWILRYREDLKYDLTSIPQFLDTIYFGLVKKQIIHNWVTFIALFYVGIFTLFLWWLKDVSLLFLNFKAWINDGFKNPSLITSILTISLLLLCIIHIYSAVRRKQLIYRINSFVGYKIISETDIIQMKSSLNKSWRRGFILSLIIILVIPIIVRLILKLLVKK